MKKIFLLLFSCLLLSGMGYALPGDTTWVQATNTEFTHYGNFDTTIAFPNPGGTYRRVYMIFTLGKYMCPAGSSYCGDWDYTVTNYLMTPGGDTLEISRLITPYANAGAPRTPWSWQQHYVYDVSDYQNLLHDSATIRVNYSGYSWGFTGNIKFMFIEGTPDRNVLGVKKMWSGYWAYGDTTHHDSNNINVHLAPKFDTAPAMTQYGELKFTVTGHGSDANYCNEFCSHNYYVYLNGGIVDNYTVWRSDCGMNELYPQSGTWLYERANWCPGALVYSKHHKLPGVVAGSYSAVNVGFDPYISNGGAGYGIEGQLFYYGGYNKVLDASMDQIIAPNRDENHFRENPICGSPIVHIKNTGATTIDSVTIQYGVAGYPTAQYTWFGTLNSLEETDVTLPAMPVLDSISGHTPVDTTYFTATILRVNGMMDNDRLNDTMRSQFIAGPVFPNPFKIVFTTNNEPIATGSNISETSWFIFNLDNTIMYSRALVNISTVYTDTISLPPGCYRLVVRKMNNFSIPMNGYVTSGTFNNDFGCGYSQYFTINAYPTSVTDVNGTAIGLEVFPNPASGQVTMQLNGVDRVEGTLQIADAMGRIVGEQKVNQTTEKIDVSAFATGLYTFTWFNTTGEKLTARILVQK
jgi:Peptide-N-glycosidase F, C terminal/Secretion system C-terminal sorting domain